jgi:acyl-CoA dehydrogenase
LKAAVYPRSFYVAEPTVAQDEYLADLAILKLAQFFQAKGLAAIKQEDQREQWYEDWIAYQAEHRIYASVLAPGQFDVLRYARFLEVFGYFSPAHGYSAQVTFLGLFAVLMGENAALKQEAAATLESGGLFAFGVSEKTHGSDLLASEFIVKPLDDGRFIANGSKYYIGNANVASMIAILAKREEGGNRRVPFVLFGLRPASSKGYHNRRKIRTLGVRGGYVGEFDVRDHEFPQTDIIAEGRGAWDAVLGTVTLGKFFLGFGSIGICEHAFEEAHAHLTSRILYGKPTMQMPHIRAAMTQAFARLTAMKLYAYRALDYLHAAHAGDRRYLLFCAVQKAKVSTEGVKVMALLSECVGAKGFESDTYFEMALRDIQLIPGLESSAHINLGLTAQFCGRYFDRFDSDLPDPKSLVAGETPSVPNEFLTSARSGAINSIAFPPVMKAYESLMGIANVRLFARQIERFRSFLAADPTIDAADTQYSLAVGQCLAIIAYGQLIAEAAHRLNAAAETVAAIFHLLIADLSAAALTLAALPKHDPDARSCAQQMVTLPITAQADWDSVAARMDSGR